MASVEENAFNKIVEEHVNVVDVVSAGSSSSTKPISHTQDVKEESSDDMKSIHESHHIVMSESEGPTPENDSNELLKDNNQTTETEDINNPRDVLKSNIGSNDKQVSEEDQLQRTLTEAAVKTADDIPMTPVEDKENTHRQSAVGENIPNGDSSTSYDEPEGTLNNEHKNLIEQSDILSSDEDKPLVIHGNQISTHAECSLDSSQPPEVEEHPDCLPVENISDDSFSNINNSSTMLEQTSDNVVENQKRLPPLRSHIPSDNNQQNTPVSDSTITNTSNTIHKRKLLWRKSCEGNLPIVIKVRNNKKRHIKKSSHDDKNCKLPEVKMTANEAELVNSDQNAKIIIPTSSVKQRAIRGCSTIEYLRMKRSLENANFLYVREGIPRHPTRSTPAECSPLLPQVPAGLPCAKAPRNRCCGTEQLHPSERSLQSNQKKSSNDTCQSPTLDYCDSPQRPAEPSHSNKRKLRHKRYVQIANVIALRKMRRRRGIDLVPNIEGEQNFKLTMSAPSAEEKAIAELMIRESNYIKSIDCSQTNIAGKTATSLINMAANNPNITNINFEGASVSPRTRQILDHLTSQNKEIQDAARDRRQQKRNSKRAAKLKENEIQTKLQEKRMMLLNRIDRKAFCEKETRMRATLVEEREKSDWDNVVKQELQDRNKSQILTISMNIIRSQHLTNLVTIESDNRHCTESEERNQAVALRRSEMKQRDRLTTLIREYNQRQSDDRKILTSEEQELRRTIRLDREQDMTVLLKEAEEQLASLKSRQREIQARIYEQERAVLKEEARKKQVLQERESERRDIENLWNKKSGQTISDQTISWNEITSLGKREREQALRRHSERLRREEEASNIKRKEQLPPQLEITPLSERSSYLSQMINGNCVYIFPQLVCTLEVQFEDELSEAVVDTKLRIIKGTITLKTAGDIANLLITTSGGITEAVDLQEGIELDESSDILIENDTVMCNGDAIATIEEEDESTVIRISEQSELTKRATISIVQLLLRLISWSSTNPDGDDMLIVDIELFIDKIHYHDNVFYNIVSSSFTLPLQIIPTYLTADSTNYVIDYIEDAGHVPLIRDFVLNISPVQLSQCSEFALAIHSNSGWTSDDEISLMQGKKGDSERLTWSFSNTNLLLNDKVIAEVFSGSPDEVRIEIGGGTKNNKIREPLRLSSSSNNLTINLLFSKTITFDELLLFISSLMYSNKSKKPTDGVRTVNTVLRNIGDEMACGCAFQFNVISVDDPCAMDLCTTDAYFRISFYDFPPSLQQFATEQPPLIIAPRALVEDVDTVVFSGGWLSVQITANSSKGDCLYVVLSKDLTYNQMDSSISAYGSILCYLQSGYVFPTIQSDNISQKDHSDKEKEYIKVDFASNKTATVPGVQLLVRSIGIICAIEKKAKIVGFGTLHSQRTVTVQTVVGDPGDTSILRKYDPNIPLEAKVNITVLEPFMSLPIDKCSFTHREGSGLTPVPPVSLLQEDHKDWIDVSHLIIRASVVSGSGAEDSLGLKEVDCSDWFTLKAYVGASENHDLESAWSDNSSLARTLSSEDATKRWQGICKKRADKLVFTAKKLEAAVAASNNIVRYDIINDQKQVIGFWHTKKGEIYIELHKPKRKAGTSGESTLRRKDIQQVVRSISYEALTSDPTTLKKVIRISVEDQHRHGTQCMCELTIQEVDDVTEIHRPGGSNLVLQYRQSDSSEGMPVAENATLYDPDTYVFNNGIITCSLTSGGDQGDQLGMLSLQGQKDRWLGQTILADVDKTSPEFWEDKPLITLKQRQLLRVTPEGDKIELLGEVRTDKAGVGDKSRKKDPTTAANATLSLYFVDESGSVNVSGEKQDSSSMRRKKKQRNRKKQREAQKDNLLTASFRSVSEDDNASCTSEDGSSSLHESRSYKKTNSKSRLNEQFTSSDDVNSDTSSQGAAAITIKLAQYIMTCITYKNIQKATKLKPGIRSYILRVGTGTSEPGKLKININVFGPLLYNADFIAPEATYTGGGTKAIINPKINTSIPADKTLTSGFVHIFIAEGLDEGDRLVLPAGYTAKAGKPHLYGAKDAILGHLQTDDTSSFFRINFDQNSRMTGRLLIAFLRTISFYNLQSVPNELHPRRIDVQTCSTGPQPSCTLSSLINFQIVDAMTEVTLGKQQCLYYKSSPFIYIFEDSIVDDSDTPLFDSPAFIEIAGTQSDVFSIGNKHGIILSPNGLTVSYEDVVIAKIDDGDKRRSPSKLRLLLINCPLPVLELLVCSITFSNSGKSEHTAKKTIRLSIKATSLVATTKAFTTVELLNPMVDWYGVGVTGTTDITLDVDQPTVVFQNASVGQKNVSPSTTDIQLEVIISTESEDLENPLVVPLLFLKNISITKKLNELIFEKEKIGTVTESSSTTLKIELRRKQQRLPDYSATIQRVVRCLAIETDKADCPVYFFQLIITDNQGLKVCYFTFVGYVCCSRLLLQPTQLHSPKMSISGSK